MIRCSALIGCLLAACLATPVRADLPLGRLQAPPGFHISVYARVADARSLALAPDGTVFVATRRAGRVYALRDTNHDNRADTRFLIADDLPMPNGIDLHAGDLYVGALGRILRYPAILTHLDSPPTPQVVRDDLPTQTHHGWRYLRFGPDGKLYLSIGAPCNVCAPQHAGLIERMQPNGTQTEVMARGVRNSVGFDWQPGSGDLWFTDNGRDWLGDDRPSDELNHVTDAGQHFGFPYCHAGEILDPEFGKGKDCDDYRAPAAKLGAHVAALGMRFYTGAQFPKRYRQAIFIAEHGSWNRSSKVGYRVVAAFVDDSRVTRVEPFVTGWLEDQSAWGRPVDVLVMPDGSLLVSDDASGSIYRIAYSAPAE